MSNRSRVRQYPDGTCIRDYIHIIDLAQAHINALEPGRRGFYNLGNGDGYSVRQVIETCEKVTGKSIAAANAASTTAVGQRYSRPSLSQPMTPPL